MAINEGVSGTNSVAITGTATGGNSLGVLGKGDAVGVRGESQNWHAVVGLNTGTQGAGVYGHSAGTGVIGESATWMGVYGKSDSTTGGAGVMGEAIGPGVIGKSQTWMGVYGKTKSTTGGAGVWGEHKAGGIGVVGVSNSGPGIKAVSTGSEAVHAETNSPGTAAVAAYNLNPAGTGAAIYAKKVGSQGHAGFFDGKVWIGGDLAVGGDIQLANADAAENFDCVHGIDAEPGVVVSLTDEGPLAPCTKAYDQRVVGVVSGAGAYKPGLLLDSRGGDNRRPVALFGKVYCKVDATVFAVKTGDLLTTSETPGHAMKAADPQRAFGAVIGKALASLENGTGLLPILVGLR